MWYIYYQDNQFLYSKTQPETDYVTVNRMPPRPVREGFVAALKADMTAERVWWELIETVEHMASEVRCQRDKLLADTDWTQVMDAPITEESILNMRAYRQALRDMTEQEGFPENVIFPQMPETTKKEMEGDSEA